MEANPGGLHATYHLAPNFSIAAPPNGMLYLGSIIDDLKNPDVINEDDLVDIPPHKKHKDVKHGFTASRSSMKNGEFGIWAKAVGLEGIGGEISASLGRSSEVTYRFDSIETIIFSADIRYIKQAMNKQDVKDYIDGSGNKPVYIVTGLKIARGPAVSIQESRTSETTTDASVSQPEVFPVDLGTRTRLASGTSNSIEFKHSTDFVIGFRVKKLQYKKKWFSEDTKLVVEKHDKGATLVGAGPITSAEEELDVEELPFGQDMVGMMEIHEVRETCKSPEEEWKTNWVVSSDRI
ncbi:hypothetical protein CKAH01_18218 [Colletotrichum kahawae]|uniref:Uncharacterized protein n=1 Tax=Colletotrichum kahawae TaxID=34407 RepID=A0AAD9Y9E0_COLKA|nr:hypothetical protein CKAH01_18218 [Colletotrichum kahawae]